MSGAALASVTEAIDARQLAGAVLMVRPAAFGANPETAASNRFQENISADSETGRLAQAEFDALANALAAAGVDVERQRWGVMVETPAAALCVEEICETGVDFVSFGTNDLTQYTLAVDRNNELVADRFDELHPGVLALIEGVIETCRECDVDTSICGQAGSRPEMVDFLVECGISSISANVDAVRDVQHEVKRVEQRLLLDSVR